MAFDFPALPSVGSTYTVAGISYVWDGIAWNMLPGIPSGKTAQTRNRVINPCGRISQELGGTGLTNTSGWFADQWYIANTVAGLQHLTNQIGGRLRCRIQNATASIAAGEYVFLYQPLEGLDLADLLWGQTIGLPVVVRLKMSATVAGIYAVSIRNQDGTRSYTHCFALAANTPTLISVPVPPCLDGTWVVTAAAGLTLAITLASGTTFKSAADDVWGTTNSLAGPTITNNASAVNTVDVWDVGFHLDPENTGIAPPFQERGYAEELRLCMRYYEALTLTDLIMTLRTDGGGQQFAHWDFTTPKRTNPTITATMSSGVSVYQATVNSAAFLYTTNGTTLTAVSAAKAIARM